MTLRRFGKRLHHDVPPWVDVGNFFHIRVRIASKQQILLTCPSLARAILESAEFYHRKDRWWLRLFVLMPDHLHALISLPASENLNALVGDWKRWLAAHHQIRWQEGYFDHRLRQDARGEQLQAKADYILLNPVRAELCTQPECWPWKIEHQ